MNSKFAYKISKLLSLISFMKLISNFKKGDNIIKFIFKSFIAIITTLINLLIRIKISITGFSNP